MTTSTTPARQETAAPDTPATVSEAPLEAAVSHVSNPPRLTVENDDHFVDLAVANYRKNGLKTFSLACSDLDIPEVRLGHLMLKRLTDAYTIRRVSRPTEVLAENLLKQGAAAYVRMYNRLQPTTPVEAVSLVDGEILQIDD